MFPQAADFAGTQVPKWRFGEDIREVFSEISTTMTSTTL
jgi:hypothetical protein